MRSYDGLVCASVRGDFGRKHAGTIKVQVRMDTLDPAAAIVNTPLVTAATRTALKRTTGMRQKVCLAQILICFWAVKSAYYSCKMMESAARRAR